MGAEIIDFATAAGYYRAAAEDPEYASLLRRLGAHFARRGNVELTEGMDPDALGIASEPPSPAEPAFSCR